MFPLTRSDRRSRSEAGPSRSIHDESQRRPNRSSKRLRTSLSRLAGLAGALAGFCARAALPVLLLAGGIAFLSRLAEDIDRLGRQPLRKSNLDLCPHPIYGFSLAPDAETAVACGRDHAVVLLDVGRGCVTDRFQVDGGTPRQLAWAPDGGAFLTGSDDGTVQLWSRGDDGFRPRRLGRYTEMPQACAWSKDGVRAAVGWKDGTTRLYNPVGTGPVAELRLAGTALTALAFLPDGRLAIADATGRIQLWDGCTGSPPRRLADADAAIVCLSVAEDGRYLIAGGMYGTLQRRELPTGRVQWEVKSDSRPDQQCLPIRVCHSTTGLVASAGTGDPRFAITLWDAATGETLSVLDGHDGDVSQLAFDPVGTRLFSAGYDGTFRIWEIETGRVVVLPKLLLPVGSTEGRYESVPETLGTIQHAGLPL